MTVDPITTQVTIGRFQEVADTMAYALYHSGYSPILRESMDGTAGLTDAAGRVLAIGGGLQYHLLTYQAAISAVLERFPADQLRPGDVILANDPYTVGTGHLPDMLVATPVFHDAALVGFGVSIAHKPDIGGSVPGSSSAAATEIFHDGLRLSPVRLSDHDGLDPTVEAIIRANSRVPDTVIGDLRGQIGATRIGAQRLASLCDEYGRATVEGAAQALFDLTNAWLRRELDLLESAESSVTCIVDHAGSSPSIEIHIRLHKVAERLIVDFTGTTEQTSGPLNCVPASVCSAALLAIASTLDPNIPVNSGLLDAVDFVVPAGSVVNPRYPASVNAYAFIVMAVYTCALSAIGDLKPNRAVAPAGLGHLALAVGYQRSANGAPGVQYELMDTSLGATDLHDGVPFTGTICHYSGGTPIEVIESEYPVRLRRFAPRIDSGGAGRHRGGIGFVREYEFLDDCTMNARWTNRTHGSWGVAGGAAPALPSVYLRRTEGVVSLDGMVSSGSLQAGDILCIESSGGGGFGAPIERDTADILNDVLDGYVSVAAARSTYGIEVDLWARTATRFRNIRCATTSDS